MSAVADGRYVGRAVLRVEDRPLLTGRGCFVDDVRRAALSACIVRSDVAHGRIVRVSTEAARALPGVVAAITGQDVPDVRIPVRMMPSEEAAGLTQPPLARERVRYVGEPIAVVVAHDRYRAEDAAALVQVDIEALPPALDGQGALERNAPLLHEGTSSNVANHVHAVYGRPVEELFGEADVVLSERLAVQRHAAIPLETRGLLAEHDALSGKLTVWGPTKVKHFNRKILASLLDMREQDIRFLEPDVGGGFGARGEFYPEDFIVPWLAMELGRAVKWIEDRREHFLASNHSRESSCDLELAVGKDGRLLAFKASAIVNQGAYARTHGTLLLPWILVRHLPGPYVWQGFEAEARSVVSNKTPSGTYRGPAQYEAAFFRERMLDRAAGALDIDPAELRQRNLIAAASMPFTMSLAGIEQPVAYDGGDFPKTFRALLQRCGYGAAAAEAARRRRRGELRGIGVAPFVEEAAFGRFEYARVVASPDERFRAYVGTASLGQGVRTSLAQVLADELKVAIERVEIVHDDTDLVPEGSGAYASRTTALGGSAVLRAAGELLSNALTAAAERLEIAEADLQLVPGGIVRPRGQGGGGFTLSELGCEGSCRFEIPRPVFDMGACFAEVDVDPGTGAVSVRRLGVCQDVGRVVNPPLVDGQLVGAAAQGLGGALLEELAYDDRGQPLCASFIDYLMPTASEVPAVDALALELPHYDPATENPLGVKGCGEGGLIGVGAAIANAVANAIGENPRGGCKLPLHPGRVLAMLDDEGRAGRHQRSTRVDTTVEGKDR